MWSDVSIYEMPNTGDPGTPEFVSIETVASEYPFYRFGEANRAELEQINRGKPR
jgi:hypothetical protein